MDGLFRGKSQSKMDDDDQGTPIFRAGNLQWLWSPDAVAGWLRSHPLKMSSQQARYSHTHTTYSDLSSFQNPCWLMISLGIKNYPSYWGWFHNPIGNTPLIWWAPPILGATRIEPYPDRLKKTGRRWSCDCYGDAWVKAPLRALPPEPVLPKPIHKTIWLTVHRYNKTEAERETRSNQNNQSTLPICAGWWFGTFFIFPYVGNNHPNWLIFFRGVAQPPTSCCRP